MSFCEFLFMFALTITCISSQYATEEEVSERQRMMEEQKPLTKYKKYIKCQVCELAAQSVHRIWMGATQQTEFDENEIYNGIIQTCNPLSNIGIWMLAFDIKLTNESRLLLENQQDMGKCQRECQTLRSVCNDIITSDADEIAEFLWNNRDELNESDEPLIVIANYICHSSNICRERMPKLSKKLAKKFRKKDENWDPMPEEEKARRYQYNQMLQEKRMKPEL